MKKFFACLAVFVLVSSGIRAPEPHAFADGLCYRGAVLEKSAENTGPQLQKAVSHPLLTHSGFMPAAHPFDMPEAPVLSEVVFSGFSGHGSCFDFLFSEQVPLFRPPAAFSLF